MLERCEPVHTINDTPTCCLPSNLDVLPPHALRRPHSFSTLASARVSPRLSRWPLELPGKPQKCVCQKLDDRIFRAS